MVPKQDAFLLVAAAVVVVVVAAVDVGFDDKCGVGVSSLGMYPCWTGFVQQGMQPAFGSSRAKVVGLGADRIAVSGCTVVVAAAADAAAVGESLLLEEPLVCRGLP